MNNIFSRTLSISSMMAWCLGITLVLSGLLTMVPSTYGQDASYQEVLKTVSGTVQEIDWVGGKIVVATDDGNADEVTFIIPDNAELTSGTDTIQPSDIEQGDRVDIQYVSRLHGLIVKRLVDQNTLNNQI